MLQSTPTNTITTTMRVINLIRAAKTPTITWSDAARAVCRADRGLCLDVMDRIGSWPSSELELRALQGVFIDYRP